MSVVIVAYSMARELPRTLRSLLPPYQRDVDLDDIEIIVVDNGSPTAISDHLGSGLEVAVRTHRIDDAAASPAHAANVGIGLARGTWIGLIVDGARMASPGLLSRARLATGISDRAVITAPAWHLGPGLQIDAARTGYDQATEDDLLAQVRWTDDGYDLFTIASPAASSGRGLFGPMGESSSLFLHRDVWHELGGLDERFSLPGGGLVNHDLYRRACSRPGVELVVLLGEGTFHQMHGGAATSGRVTREQMRAEYEEICGEAHRPPANVPTFVGSIPQQYLPFVESSVALARERHRQT